MWLRALLVVPFVLLVSVNCDTTQDCTHQGVNNSTTVCNKNTTTNNGTSNKTLPQELTALTPKPVTIPKSMNMIAEDQIQDTSAASKTTSEEPKARALNFTLDEHSTRNILTQNSSKARDKLGDLSDVTINEDDDEEVHEMQSAKILATKNESSFITKGICTKGGLTYEHGEKLENDCESVCTCLNGKMDCADRCSGPYFRRGKKIEDPLCTAKDADDPCCAILICTADTETEPLEICSYGNQTFNRGETFYKGCDEVCLCEIAGKSSCKPRCPAVTKTSDRCVEVPDPNDSCCKKVLCDVTLDDHDSEKEDENVQKHKLISAKFLNSTTVELNLDASENKDVDFIEGSDDKIDWKTYKVNLGKLVDVMGGTKFLKLENSDDIVEIMNSSSSNENNSESSVSGCLYKGRKFEIGEEFNDNCSALCVCKATGMKCLKMECPTYFGVDVLDPGCIEWETVPPNFVPSPPNCCPDEVRCKNNGSCMYEGQMYPNLMELPSNVTGCEKRCYCETGNVECHNACAPVTALPPPTLNCPPHLAMIDHVPDDECCMEWTCKHGQETGHNKTKTTTEAPSKSVGPLYGNNNSVNSVPDNSFYNENKGEPFLGPYNPNFKKQPFKDNNLMFKTPPPNRPLNENYIPNQEPAKLPKVPQTSVHVHANGNPEEILQFINHHPEIANYPSGSVLEIHNRPYLPHDLNSGISLEQILQEIHKSGHVPPSVLPVTPQNHFANNKGLPPGGQIFPGNFPGVPQAQDEISVHVLEPIDAHTIRLAFMVPPILVGLHGRVEVRYTHKPQQDMSSWELQVFAPPNDLIATPQLEFDLRNLKEDTEYSIKITITLRDLHNTPSSQVYKIRTPKDTKATTLPPMIPIDPNLEISDINATWVTVVWRKFTEYELQFIDGVQLRFKEIDGKIYDATPLIHRSVTSYTLENLKPNTKYEIGIFFIPFPGQLTELHFEHMLHFTTANEVDTYGFNVSLDITHIKSTSVEITWAGVPYPEDKYVNIYRAIYQSDSGKEDQSTFKIAKRDSPTKTVIMDLKPGTRYRLWLEVYLTNGKIKTSNVQDFITKPRAAPALGASSQQGGSRDNRGDYYGPLVIVAILAAIAILSTLILLLILVRRHNQNKAAITPPTRVSQSAYDNPTYKVEIQQETMGL